MPFKKIIVSLVLTLSLLLSLNSYAKSPVFKISNKGGDYVYIGGTIHLLSPNDYPLPLGFEQAFEDAKQVFFEVDSGDISSPETQAKMASVMMFQGGRTLESQLNKETYDALSAFLAERQLPISAFSRLTPAGVSLTLTLFELQRLGLGNPENGVDHFYQLKTEKIKTKSEGFLETIDEQIGFLESLNQVDSNVLIKSSLEDLASLQASWEEGLRAWRDGDMAAMNIALGGDKMKTQFPVIFKTLLTDRNNRWLGQITTMFETKDVELILVGAMHLVGEDGVIELLRQQGYAVEQLN